MKKLITAVLRDIGAKKILLMILGGAVVAFGIYNVHDVADITEGGIFGLDLLLLHHFGISPGITNFILTAVCFFIGFKALGKTFIISSAISTGAFSLFYFLFEKTPRVYPQIAEHPLSAAVIGAVFVGVGVGLSVSMGGAQSGDDALAMAISHFFKWKISAVYLISDLAVLLLSLTYIPYTKILYSLLTVVLSGQIIELFVRFFGKSEAADAQKN